MGQKGSVIDERELLFGKMRDIGSKGSRCGEPEIAVSAARKAKNSLDSAGSRRVLVRVTYSKRNVPLAVVEANSPSTWQENSTSKWNAYVRAGFPK